MFGGRVWRFGGHCYEGHGGRDIDDRPAASISTPVSPEADRGRLLGAHDLPDRPRHKEDGFRVDSEDSVVVIRIGLVERYVGCNINLRHIAVRFCGIGIEGVCELTPKALMQ